MIKTYSLVPLIIITTVCDAWTEPDAILHFKSGFLDPYYLVNIFFYKISYISLESQGFFQQNPLFRILIRFFVKE